MDQTVTTRFIGNQNLFERNIVQWYIYACIQFVNSALFPIISSDCVPRNFQFYLFASFIMILNTIRLSEIPSRCSVFNRLSSTTEAKNAFKSLACHYHYIKWPEDIAPWNIQLDIQILAEVSAPLLCLPLDPIINVSCKNHCANSLS